MMFISGDFTPKVEKLEICFAGCLGQQEYLRLKYYDEARQPRNNTNCNGKTHSYA